MTKWEEGKHPRDEKGQFSSGESSSSKAHQTGPFGKIFTEYKHDAQGAIAKLKEEQGGEAIGALHHPDIGDIDLIWGEMGDPDREYAGGYGLSKIIAKHPEVVDDLQNVLLSTKVNTEKSGENRVILTSDDDRYRSVINLTWKKQDKKWLLTAYDLTLGRKGKSIGTDMLICATSIIDEALSSTNALEYIIDQKIMEYQAKKHNNVLLAMDKKMRSYDGNGHLLVERTIITKAAVNEYWGSEIPEYQSLGLQADKKYKLLRDPEELKEALFSFQGIQLLIKHTPVNADEPHNDITVGSVHDFEMKGNDVYGSLRVFDQSAIDLIESGKLQELSAGYAYRADMTSGEFEGQVYDGVMRQIHGNHVALVERGRIGRDAVISDSLPMDLMEKSMKIKKGSVPKIYTVLQRIAQDSDVSESDVEEVVKVVKDSFEEDEKPGAEDETCVGTSCDEQSEKAEDEDDQESDAQDEAAESTESKDKKPAMDADAIQAAAVQKVTALFEAREAVKPLVGVVAMDSAEKVYGYALKQKGINISGVHTSAYKPMVDMLLNTQQTKLVAMDADVFVKDELTDRFR